MRSAGKLFLFLLVVLVGISLWFSMRRTPQRYALQARSIATRGLAEELVKRRAGTRAVIVSNPFAQTPGVRKEIQAVEDVGIHALKEGFGSAIKVEAVEFPPIRPEARENPRSVYIPDTTTPLSYLVAEDSFDQIAQSHPDCDLIISLIGFPARLDKVQIWRQSGAPRFGLLFPDLRMVGDKEALREALQSTKLAAVVLYKPDGVRDQEPVKGEFKEEFASRFLLVTADTYDQIARKYPQLFELTPLPMPPDSSNR